MRRIIACVVAGLMLAASVMMPAAAFAGVGRNKVARDDGSPPTRWDLKKPKLPRHEDVAPPTAGGAGDGVNGITFGAFDDGDIVVVLGTATGHAGIFDAPYYGTLSSWAIVSANTTPRNGVQREQCAKYRTYDTAYALWLPRWAVSGWRARNYARSKMGQPYDITSSKADQSRWYCSKLCWAAWRYPVGPDIDWDGGYWVWPVDLINSAYTSLFGYWG